MIPVCFTWKRPNRGVSWQDSQVRMDEAQVKKSEVGQEGEGAGGVNVYREFTRAQPFVAELKVPKANFIGTEAKVEKPILTNNHLGTDLFVISPQTDLFVISPQNPVQSQQCFHRQGDPQSQKMMRVSDG